MYHEYALEVLTQPFFLVQYFIVLLLILEKLELFGILMLGSTIVTVTINYIMLYLSYAKIKAIAEKESETVVVRNGEKITINSNEIVPGDLFVPKEDLPCDCILVSGEVYVN